MNTMNKAFCRTYQSVLRLAIPILPYRSPKVLDSVTQVPDVLKQKGITRVLIVTDGFLHLSGMLEPLKKALSENGQSLWFW